MLRRSSQMRRPPTQTAKCRPRFSRHELSHDDGATDDLAARDRLLCPNTGVSCMVMSASDCLAVQTTLTRVRRSTRETLLAAITAAPLLMTPQLRGRRSKIAQRNQRRRRLALADRAPAARKRAAGRGCDIS